MLRSNGIRLQRTCTGFTIITVNVGRYLEKGVEGILYVSEVSILILLLSTSFLLQALKKQSFSKFNHSVTNSAAFVFNIFFKIRDYVMYTDRFNTLVLQGV